MATREYTFISTGIETSTAPTASDPAAPGDVLTLGYADNRYTQGGPGVADLSALVALDTTDRRDKDSILVESENALYRYDSTSVEAANSPYILEPSSTTGRWYRLTDFNTDGSLDVNGTLTVTGDLEISGTTTTVDTATLDVTDANVTVNKGGTQSTANAQDAGLTVEMSDATDAKIGYDSTLASKFLCGDVGSESEIVTVGTGQTVTGLKSFNGPIQFSELGSTPSTPSSGNVKLFADNAGALKSVDDAGVVTTLGGSGSITDGTTTTKGITLDLSGEPAVFTFNTWNPSDVSGTNTFANSLGSGFGDEDVSFSSLSSGTVTITFNVVGVYSVNMSLNHNHSANFSLSILKLIYGGTSSNFSIGDFEMREVVTTGGNNINHSGSDYFITRVTTVGQTLTVNGSFLVSGSGLVGNHLATVRGFIKRIK